MSVTEGVMQIGQWSVDLADDTPESIRERLDFLSHVYVTRSRLDADLLGRPALLYPGYEVFPAVPTVTSELQLPGGPGDHASTADHDSLDIVGDIDIRWHGAADQWAGDQTLVAKIESTDSHASWGFALDAGRPIFRISRTGGPAGGSPATADVPVGAGVRVGLRATREALSGTVTYYTSIDGGVSWQQLGDPVSTLAGDLFAGTARVEIGQRDGTVGTPSNMFAGVVDWAELRDGIDGTVVADPDFAAQTQGTVEFADGAGRTWTLFGDATIVPVGEDFVQGLFPTSGPFARAAAFAGVVTRIPRGDQRGLSGYGLAWWLGAGDKGPLIEQRVLFHDANAETLLRRLLPLAIRPGAAHDTDSRFSGTVERHQTVREALDHALSTIGCEWRVNPDGTLDAGPPPTLFGTRLLYPTAPLAALVAAPQVVAASSKVINTSQVTTPSTTPSQADDFELRWTSAARWAGDLVSWTPPAGFTERADLLSRTFVTASLATRTLESDGPTGVHTFALSAPADFGHGFTVNCNNLHGHRTVLRSVATVETDDETASFSCGRPDGVKPGDLLVAFHSSDWGEETSMGPPVGGGAWTQVGVTETDGLNNLHTKVWQRVAGDNEPGSYQFSQDPTADGVAAVAAVTWEPVGGRTVLFPSPNLHPRKWAQTAVAVRKDVGWDLDLEALQVSSLTLDSDIEDWASDVLLLGRGEESEPTVARARERNVPYRDLHGDPARMTLMAQESATEELTAAERAVVLLNDAQPARRQVSLSVADFDVDGDAKAGHLIGVYDPEEGLFDLANPQQWRGHTIYPIELRVTQTSWPITSGMGVYLRDAQGRIVDLTDHVEFGDGPASLTVGATSRSFVGLDRQTEALRSTLRLEPLYSGPEPEPAAATQDVTPTPRAAIIRRLTTQNSVNAADTFVVFTSMDVGDDAMWTGSNPTRLFLPVPGLWEIHAGVTWDGSTAGARRLNIQRDDGPLIAEGRPGTSGVRHGDTCSTYMTSDGSQWVRLLAVQTSGGNLPIGGDDRTFLTATYIRPL